MQTFRLNRRRLHTAMLLLPCVLLTTVSAPAQERSGAGARPVWEKKNGIVDPTYRMPMPHLTPPKEAGATAHWIWLGPVVGDQQVEVRTVFALPAKPKTAQVWVTADDAFTLFINGRQVEKTQPVEQGWAHAHQREVAAYLHAGKNVLAVQGTNQGGGAAGVLVELDVNGVQTVVSDSRWKALLSASPPADWTGTSLDDSGWQNATDEGAVGTGVWGRGVTDWPHMGASNWYMAHKTLGAVQVEALPGPDRVQNLSSLLHRAPANTIVGSPESNLAPGPRRILVDFGKELSGRIEIAGTEGAQVEVHTGETREAALRILKDARLIAIDNSGPWSLTLHGREVQTTPYTAFRYALLTFPGDQPVALTQVDCDFKYYPVEYKGAFDCSDPLLTQIWYTGAYTAHLCMQEDIWDAPKRDRGLWIGDMHVTGETINNVFADRFLVERSIAGGRAIAQRGRPDTEMPPTDVNDIPGYTAAYFGTLADFYRHDGDLAFLRSQHNSILSLLAYQQTQFDARHLFTNPYHAWDFCDWAPGYVKDTPQTLAATDLFAIYGVRQAVFLLTALGDTANAAKYTAWADTLTQAARTLLLDPHTQTYGNRVQENAMAVYADVATPAQQAQIYRTVLKAGTPAWTVPSAGDLAGSEVMSPYYGNYVLSAYGRLGQVQAGIDLMRRYWGGMLARGTTTWWECFDPSFPQDMNWSLDRMPYLSLCHGWSSGPTSYLTESVLGVKPTSGGFKTVTIQPQLGDLAWAEGTVPTPHGSLRLHVKKGADGLVCALTLPAGIHALAKLPGLTVSLDHAGTYTLRSADRPHVTARIQTPNSR